MFGFNGYANDVRDNRTKGGMQTFNLNGVDVKTNYGSVDYPLWDGNEVPNIYDTYYRVDFGKSDADLFNELVDNGYTRIRFVEMTTRVRGWHNVYAFAAR